MRACTVEASRVRIRSTPEEARLFAMAVPFDVNSSVISCRSVRTETYQVTAASGMRTTARNTTIFGSNPNRKRDFITGPLDRDGRRPVGDRNPAFALDAGEIDRVQALVPLGSESERGTDAEIETPQRLERLPERRPRRLRSGALQRLHDHLRVHEALEADEAVALDGIARIAQCLRHRRIVAVHQQAVLGHRRQAQVVVARYDLGVHERARVVATRLLAVLDEQGQHRV